jgi:hypothetical protein
MSKLAEMPKTTRSMYNQTLEADQASKNNADVIQSKPILHPRVILYNVVVGFVGIPVRARAVNIRNVHESSHLRLALEKL